jgi:hypothetical protein
MHTSDRTDSKSPYAIAEGDFERKPISPMPIYHHKIL